MSALYGYTLPAIGRVTNPHRLENVVLDEPEKRRTGKYSQFSFFLNLYE